jgi:hypothetical protein
MKKMTFERRQSAENRTKTFCMTSRTEDRESTTQVKKSFHYMVSLPEAAEPSVLDPEIFIRKGFDSKRRQETFNFQVIGSFYMTHERRLLRVDFHHVLDIQIDWKKDFSPKKSAVLTKG